LLADRDTTLVFEQPELHLHPMVQTRLGDFFLSIVLAGKQCLIETHSEYLVSRLRHRAAAEGKTNRVTDNMKIYFVEKKNGASDFRDVNVNEYGAILDWPEGFFDQSAREAEDILRAAMKKRRAERSGEAQK
jgi:predicted ATPase